MAARKIVQALRSGSVEIIARALPLMQRLEDDEAATLVVPMVHLLDSRDHHLRVGALTYLIGMEARFGEKMVEAGAVDRLCVDKMVVEELELTVLFAHSILGRLDSVEPLLPLLSHIHLALREKVVLSSTLFLLAYLSASHPLRVGEGADLWQALQYLEPDHPDCYFVMVFLTNVCGAHGEYAAELVSLDVVARMERVLDTGAFVMDIAWVVGNLVRQGYGAQCANLVGRLTHILITTPLEPADRERVLSCINSLVETSHECARAFVTDELLDAMLARPCQITTYVLASILAAGDKIFGGLFNPFASHITAVGGYKVLYVLAGKGDLHCQRICGRWFAAFSPD